MPTWEWSRRAALMRVPRPHSWFASRAGVRAERWYVDVGTLHGYRETTGLLQQRAIRRGGDRETVTA
jgi:hypothetical protein